jgi:hypothetical protein
LGENLYVGPRSRAGRAQGPREQLGVRPPRLRVGVRASWDAHEREIEVVHGFPDDGWRRASRDARESLPVLWLPAWRDARSLTTLAGSSSRLHIHDTREQAAKAMVDRWDQSRASVPDGQAVMITGPDPVREETLEQDLEQLRAAEREERDRERDDLTREQPDEHENDRDRDNDNDLGFGIE